VKLRDSRKENAHSVGNWFAEARSETRLVARSSRYLDYVNLAKMECLALEAKNELIHMSCSEPLKTWRRGFTPVGNYRASEHVV